MHLFVVVEADDIFLRENKSPSRQKRTYLWETFRVNIFRSFCSGAGASKQFSSWIVNLKIFVQRKVVTGRGWCKLIKYRWQSEYFFSTQFTYVAQMQINIFHDDAGTTKKTTQMMLNLVYFRIDQSQDRKLGQVKEILCDQGCYTNTTRPIKYVDL